jgi:hypothetical protein
MVKVGRSWDKGGTERDGREDAGEVVVSLPWVPLDRGDARAILVSERSARFDRRMLSLPPLEEAAMVDVGALGPLPTDWTWDLVHCRLLSVHAIAKQLPRAATPWTYRSFLGAIQPEEAIAVRHKPLTAEATERFDWTFSRLYAWSERDRAVLMGVMAGLSLRKIAKITTILAARIGCEPLSKSSISRHYRALTTTMAKRPVGAAARQLIRRLTLPLPPAFVVLESAGVPVEGDR